MSLSALESSLLAVFMLLLMFGMGASLDIPQFRRALRTPKALLIGLASQFGWMPLIALGLGWGLDLPILMAVGLLVMGCSAGGTTSNFFTYLSRGDLALSISMTVVSTLAGVIVVPLLLWLYVGVLMGASGQQFEVPMANIASSLFILLVPVGLGMWLRSRSVRWAKRAETWGTIAGIAALLLVIGGNLARDGAVLFSIPAVVYLAASLLGPIGFGLGYAAARSAGLALPQARAVSLETGIQNAALALGVIVLSFPAEQQGELLLAPMLYGVIVVPFSMLAAWWFRRDGSGALTKPVA